MKLKAGQKFEAVIHDTTPGNPRFYGAGCVSQKDQETEVQVHDRMGMPSLLKVKITVPGLGPEIGIDVLVLEGSIVPEEPETQTHRIQFVNTSNYQHVDTEVEVHGLDCSHLTRFKRSWEWGAGGDAGLGDFETANEAFLDYNSDFIDEDPEGGAWPITFFPCSGLVERKKTIR